MFHQPHHPPNQLHPQRHHEGLHHEHQVHQGRHEELPVPGSGIIINLNASSNTKPVFYPVFFFQFIFLHMGGREKGNRDKWLNLILSALRYS